MSNTHYFNSKPFTDFLSLACDQYEKSAPTVHQYCDDLYSRIQADPKDVKLIEIIRIARLVEDEIWMQPNQAANYVYHLMNEIGMNTVGHAGF